MNNIEILEDYIEALRKPKPFKYTNEHKAEAIENLIQENKELYKNYLKLKSEMEILNNAYISKSKVKEKIEELEEKQNNSDKNIFGYGIYFLQELLEEGDKIYGRNN